MEGRVYECKKELEVAKWDSDNDCFLDEMIVIEKGSAWGYNGYGTVCGGEVRLDNEDTGEWLEISKETLQEYFKDITNDNNEMAENEYLRSGY